VTSSQQQEARSQQPEQKNVKNIKNSDNISLQTKKGDYNFNKIPTQTIQFLKNIDLYNF
jgi:hypothetical protein